MEYKTIKNNAYNIHFIKTNKFKTVLFKLIFRDEIKKEEITKRNMLIDNLLMTSKKYSSRKEINIEKQNLYGADIYSANRRIGNQILTEITLSILNPKYTEEGMYEKSLDFLCELLYEPNVNSNGFNEEYFELVKNNSIIEIKRNEENPLSKAANYLREEIKDNIPFSYRMEGYIEDIKKTTKESLYTYYKNFFKTNLIDIYVAGDIDFYKMEKLIEEKFKFNTIKKQKKDINVHYDVRKRINKKQIESEFVQSKLLYAIGFSKLTDKEKKCVLPLYNIILGNSPESKLFKNVREKKSYSYSISSEYRRIDNIMLIVAGISSDNYDNACKAIKKEIGDMKKGKISDEELINAKELYISVLNDFSEYLSSIIDYYFGIDYLQNDEIEKQKKNIEDVTIDEIIEVAKKIKIDTILLLEEKQNAEN